MTIWEIIQILFLGVGGIAGLIELTPIKFNPLTWLIRKLGKALNHDTNDKVDKLSKDVKTLSDEMAKREAINARVRILRFGDECRMGMKHSKDYFDQIGTDITTYENYCKDHPEFKNNITAITIGIINEIYAECLKNNDFI